MITSPIDSGSEVKNAEVFTDLAWFSESFSPCFLAGAWLEVPTNRRQQTALLSPPLSRQNQCNSGSENGYTNYSSQERAYTMILIANTPVAMVINYIHARPQEDLAMNNVNIPVYRLVQDLAPCRRL